MKIYQKLFSGYGIVALLTIVVGAVVVTSAIDIKYAIDRVALEDIPELRAATESNYHIQMIKSNIRELLLLGLTDGASRQEEIERAKATIKNDISLVRKYTVDLGSVIKFGSKVSYATKTGESARRDRELFPEYEKDVNNFLEKANKLYDLFERGQYKEALRLFEEDVSPPSRALQARIEDLEGRVYDGVAAKAGEIRTMVSRTIKIIFILGITIILFAFGFGYLISGAISGPIIKLTSAATEIGKGKLGVKIDVRSRDEVGALAAAFNKMSGDLLELVEKDKELSTKAVIAEIDHKRATELEAAYDALRKSQEGVQRNYEMQTVINKLLYLSLQTIPMEEMLGQFVGEITSISWLALESKGAILLVEDDPGVLVMKAQRGLSTPLLSLCARVPFGTCLCGRAALSKEVVFKQRLDEHHETQFGGMAPHGHYCVPVMSADKKVLGVINLYIKPERHREESEKEFLVAVANVLASIIERRKMDDSIKAAYAKLQETQDQLIQAEKLNAIGQLASGMAHEVRNPLGIVLQGINYLEGKMYPGDEADSDVLAKIKDGVKRANDIVSALLDFSRASKLDLHSEDINSILDNSLTLMKERFKDGHIDVTTDTKKGMPKISLSKNRIAQVFVNIFLNAIQAMPEGGKLFVRSYFGTEEKAVIVEVEDTGIGIMKENLSRVFDPFFTTKAPGSGTGLGLYVSKNILNMHNATINIRSQAGKGTSVRIAFKVV